MVFLIFFEIFDDLNAHGGFGRFNRRDFQHGNKARPLVMRAIKMRPGIAAFGLWVAL